jgi:PST family polysaccharide transporter
LLFTEGGMLAALIHWRGDVDRAASTAVVSSAIGGVLFSLIALGLSPLVGLLFDSDRVGTLAAALSGLLFVRSLQVVPEALLQRDFAFVRRVIIEPAQVAAFGIGAVIATSHDLGPWGLVIGFYAAAVTDVILSWILVRWRPRWKLVSFATWRELIDYGRHVLASNIVLRAGQQVPTILLGRFVGASALGQYRYADRIATTPFFFVVTAASSMIFPAFARIAQERERFVKAFEEALRWCSALAIPMGLILVPMGPALAVVLFGDVWRESGEAAMALAPICGAATITSMVSEALKAEGRPRILIHMHTVAVVTGAAAMLALLPLGLVGVAGGLSIGTCVAAGYALVRIGRVMDLPVRRMVFQIWPPTVAALVMVVVLLPIDRLVFDPPSHHTATALLLLAAEALIALAVYLPVLALLARDTAQRLRELLGEARGGGPPAEATG